MKSKKFHFSGPAPKLSHLRSGKHGGFNVPRGSPHTGAETPLISAETAEIFEVDRKFWSPLVVTYEVIKWGTTHRAGEGHGVYRNMEVLHRCDVTFGRKVVLKFCWIPIGTQCA